MDEIFVIIEAVFGIILKIIFIFSSVIFKASPAIVLMEPAASAGGIEDGGAGLFDRFFAVLFIHPEADGGIGEAVDGHAGLIGIVANGDLVEFGDIFRADAFLTGESRVCLMTIFESVADSFCCWQGGESEGVARLPQVLANAVQRQKMQG